MITFIVPGRPQGKERPRTVRNHATGRVMTYTPKHTRDYETAIWAAYNAAGGRHMGDVPVEMIVEAVYPIPKSVRKDVREKMLTGELLPTRVKPDTDNVLKCAADALNDVAYHDDTQIIKATITKRYGAEPMIRVTIKEYKEENPHE